MQNYFTKTGETMTLNQEQIDQNTQAEINDKRSHCQTGSAIGLEATELLGRIDAYLLVGQKKGYFLSGDRVITDEDLAGSYFDAAKYHAFVAAIGAIATAANDPQNDWTGAIAPIVKL